MDEEPQVPRGPAPQPLPGPAALLTGLALLFAGPEALREVAQICRSLLSV